MSLHTYPRMLVCGHAAARRVTPATIGTRHSVQVVAFIRVGQPRPTVYRHSNTSSGMGVGLDTARHVVVWHVLKAVSCAVEAYRRAVDLNPRDYRAWYGLGQTYELLHMPFYALHYFRRATQARPLSAAPAPPT